MCNTTSNKTKRILYYHYLDILLDEILYFVNADEANNIGVSQQVPNYFEGYVFLKNHRNAALTLCASPYLNIPTNMEI